MKLAIITGISGQDGAYLTKLLLENQYKVIGLVRNTAASFNGLNYLGILDEVELIACDLLDITQVTQILKTYNPDEIYNLAAQSSVSESYANPIGTFEFNTISVFNIIEAIRNTNPAIKLYQASSSEMFGKVGKLPITETSLIHPLSPYAISKVAAHYTCVNYRESYGLFICCGILFNHESYLRSSGFFVKKVIRESLEISQNKRTNLQVGNIDIKRDFGYAPKYVEAMHLLLQQEKPSDYLICSGQSVSLRDIIYYVFDKLNIDRSLCVINKAFYRPADIEDIYGNNEKAKTELSWQYDLDFFEVLDLLIEEEISNDKKNH
ncbi:GDP-mannose 4,6-dehydratase [Flavobacterium sp.]|uniref:GDP-mannose 4,6-dehydratase n=1 Tax=Flavobacterium sp. TaxID=239 RepID=UPI00286CFCD1|nr:GDP-mannose 4,6-dehydratase [Flavobacterium sp.]